MKSSTINPAIAPLILIFLGILLLASFPLIQHLQKNEKLLLDSPAILEKNTIKEISVQEAKLLHDKDLVVFLEISSSQDYEEQHIPGALNIPLDTLEQQYETLNSKNWIIVYSSTSDNEITKQAGTILLQNGFSRVNALSGGISNWKNHGYPVTIQP